MLAASTCLEARGLGGLSILERSEASADSTGSSKNQKGMEEQWERGKKEINNKEGQEEPWKRGKKGMNNREGREGSRKRGKKGLKTKKREGGTMYEREGQT